MIVALCMNPALDASAEVDRVEATAKLRCGERRRDPGGGGVNVARAAHELGAEAVAVFPAGGETGDALTALLREGGVETSRVKCAGATRENLTVIEREGERRQFRFAFPNAPVSEAEQAACLDAVSERLTREGTLVISGSLAPGVAPSVMTRAIELARGRSARVVGDSSGVALRALAEGGVDLLKPNMRELSALAGSRVEGVDGAWRAARALVDRGCAGMVVVSMGRDGACLVTGEEALFAGNPEVELDSVIGAGDSMVGALTVALGRGLSTREALRWGVAAGTAAVMTPGTTLLRRADFEALRERVEVRECA